MRSAWPVRRSGGRGRRRRALWAVRARTGRSAGGGGGGKGRRSKFHASYFGNSPADSHTSAVPTRPGLALPCPLAPPVPCTRRPSATRAATPTRLPRASRWISSAGRGAPTRPAMASRVPTAGSAAAGPTAHCCIWNRSDPRLPRLFRRSRPRQRACTHARALHCTTTPLCARAPRSEAATPAPTSPSHRPQPTPPFHPPTVEQASERWLGLPHGGGDGKGR